MMESTSMESPYSVLRPMRCRGTKKGAEKGADEICGHRAGDINWMQPDTHAFRCKRCGTDNVIFIPHIVVKTPGDDA